MKQKEDIQFVSDIFKYRYHTSLPDTAVSYLSGLRKTYNLIPRFDNEGYSAPSVDVIVPTAKDAFVAFTYNNTMPAAVAYKSAAYRSVSLAFPFECIRTATKRTQAMKAILKFLIK